MVLTQEILKILLKYENGKLFWLNKTSNYSRVDIGSECGSLHSSGYRFCKLYDKSYATHRLIWFYHYGVWPENDLDHINGIRDDNRIENLRECNDQTNSFNRKSHKNSTSKYKGVSWKARDKVWTSQYCVNGKVFYIGNYKSEIEAAKAYDNKAKELHGEFARLNFG